MEFYTAYYRQRDAESVSLLVQQARVGREGTRVLLVYIGEEDAGTKGRDELAAKLSDWFWEKALLTLEKKNSKAFGKLTQQMEQMTGEYRRKNSSWAGILCVGQNAILFGHGNVGIYLLCRRFSQTCLQRVETRDIQWRTEQISLEGGRILLATDLFMNAVPKSAVEDCLGTEKVASERQLEMRMKELTTFYQQNLQGNAAAAVICIS